MKQLQYTASLLACLLISSQAQLLPFFTRNSAPPADLPQHPMAMNPPTTGGGGGPELPLAPSTSDDSKNGANPSIYLSDVVGSKPQIQIFAGFTRDLAGISHRLEDTQQNTTILAPSNTAITSLPRKPWEDPRDYGSHGAHAYAGAEGADRAQRNLERFVEAHVVPVSPWGEGEKVKSLLGGEVWWVRGSGGKVFVMPGEVEVESVVSRVANGEVWVLKGVVNYV